MTLNAFRISAIALGAAALVLSATLSTASAAAVVHHPAHAAHRYVAHGYAHHYAHRYAYRHGHRYVYWRGHRYAYGYNPGAAVAGAVIGSAIGAAATYPYGCDPYSYGWGYGSCPTYDWGGYYGPAYGGFAYGYGPGFYHRHGFYYNHGSGFNHGFGFNGGGPRFVGGNFGHMGGFGGGHMGGFGGHMGGGGHFLR